MKPIKIFLADDHTLVRKGFKSILESVENFAVIGEAENGEELLEKLEKSDPDLILLDYNMPGMNGVEITEKIREKDESIKIIMLTMHDNETIILDAISAGINGYLYKEAEVSELEHAINEVIGGKDYFSEGVKEKIIKFHKNRKRGKFYELTEERIPLSKREIEIISHIAQGLNSHEIADKLFISPFTVVKHRKNILKKLSMKNFAEVVSFAKENKII
jgi:DNA-binding NarL/FixJ family response regulator